MKIPSLGFAILGNEPTTFPDGRPLDPYAAARWLGADHVRIRIVFRGNGPHFPNAWLDDSLARAAAHGLAVELVWWVESENWPLLGDTSNVPPWAYRIFAHQLAHECQGRIRSVHIDNEPDKAGVLPDDYATRVSIAVGTWRDIDPGVLVVAGELAAEDQAVDWLKPWALAQASTGVLPDRVSLHAFDGWRDRWQMGSQYGPAAKVAWAKGVLLACGMPTDILVTECGGPSAPSNQWTKMSDDLQAMIARRTIAECSLFGAESVSWYRLADQADGAESQKFGLLRETGEAKPAAFDWAGSLFDLRMAGLVLGADTGPNRIGKIGPTP